MPHAFADIAFTPAVKALQEARGSRAGYARFEAHPDAINARLREREAAFLAERDSFYMATVNADGWPYLQHRGGPRGFVKVLDDTTLGFADFKGNRQYVSTGNLEGNDRVSLFFMDYANRRRLKLLGRAEVIGGDDPRLPGLAVEEHDATVEQGLLIRVAAFDWNCPQHITERFTLAEVEAATAALRARIAELESQRAHGA